MPKLFIVILLFVVGCTAKEVQKPSTAALLVGTWELEVMKMGEQEFPASIMAEEILFSFKNDGQVDFYSPDEEKTATYRLSDKVIHINKSEKEPDEENSDMIIENLEKDNLALKVVIDGQEAIMYFKRKKQ